MIKNLTWNQRHALGLIGGSFFLIGLVVYTDTAFRTNEYNLFKQISVEKKWIHDYNRLFGINGLADTNHDNSISFSERVNVYRMMGYNKLFEEGNDRNDNFPAPNIKELEKAINLLETQR